MFSILKGKTLLVFLLLMLWCIPAWATTFSVETLAKNNKLYRPVTFKITVTNNSSKPFNGEVVLQRIRSGSIDSAFPKYVVKVNNLTGTKNWYVKTPLGYYDGQTIAMLEQNGNVIQKGIVGFFVLQEQPSMSILYLVPTGITVPSFLSGSLQTLQAPLKQYCELIDTDPQRDYDFSAYDVIVLEDVQLLDLNKEQWKSLSKWVGRGGILVIPGGAMYALPQELATVKYNGTETFAMLPELEHEMGVNLPRGSLLTAENIEPLAGSKVDYSADNLNWIIEKKYGEGKVVVLPVQFTDKTFTSWQGSEVFWRKLVNTSMLSIPAITGYEPPSWQGQYMSSLGSLLPVQMPKSATLFIIFILYILVVGIGSYFFLRRIDRRGWMWVSTPLLAIIFFVGTYYLGASGRSSKVIVAETGTVTLHEHDTDVDAGIGVFVPAAGNYKLDLNGDFLVPNYSDGSSEKPASVEIADNQKSIIYQNMRVWSMKTAYAHFQIPVKGIIKTENVHVNDRKISLDVTNKSKYNLKECFIVQAGAFYYYIPEFKKGAKKHIDINLNLPKDIYQYFNPQNLSQQERRRFEIKNNLFMAASQQGVNPNNLVFMGFTDQQTIPVKVNSKNPDIIPFFVVRQNFGDFGLRSEIIPLGKGGF